MNKKRYIYELNTYEYNKNIDSAINNNTKCYIKESIDESQIKEIYGTQYSNKIQKRFLKRIYSDVWSLILSYYNGKLSGCMWLYIPKKKTQYDSVYVSKNEVLICGVYVNPIFRGRKIYNSMHKLAIENCMEKYSNRRIITIIEEKNKPSIKSNERIGFQVIEINTIYKIKKINIISKVMDKNGKNKYILLLLKDNLKKIIGCLK
jgi:Acetyltransferase (GNAT) family